MKRYFSLFILLSTTLFAENIVDPNTDVSFPKEVTFTYNDAEYQLTATGVATRKKFGFKIYSVASYLQNETPLQGNVFEEIIHSDRAKQLTLHWLMKVRGEKIKEGFVKTFKKGLSPSEFEELSSEINTFLTLFDKGVQKGTSHVFRSLNGDTLLALENETVVASIKSKKLQSIFWSTWFGDKPVVNRDNLIKFNLAKPVTKEVLRPVG